MSFKANLVKWFMHTLRRCWPRWSTCWTTKAIEIAWLCLGLDQQGFWFGSIANIQGTILIWFDLLGTQANPGYEVSLNGYVCASRQTRCVGTNSEILALLWLPAKAKTSKATYWVKSVKLFSLSYQHSEGNHLDKLENLLSGLPCQESCFKSDGPLAEYRGLMDRFEGGSLIHWRWSSVTQCVKAILLRKTALEKGGGLCPHLMLLGLLNQVGHCTQPACKIWSNGYNTWIWYGGIMVKHGHNNRVGKMSKWGDWQVTG